MLVLASVCAVYRAPQSCTPARQPAIVVNANQATCPGLTSCCSTCTGKPALRLTTAPACRPSLPPAHVTQSASALDGSAAPPPPHDVESDDAPYDPFATDSPKAKQQQQQQAAARPPPPPPPAAPGAGGGSGSGHPSDPRARRSPAPAPPPPAANGTAPVPPGGCVGGGRELADNAALTVFTAWVLGACAWVDRPMAVWCWP
jgi:hypothetical protein